MKKVRSMLLATLAIMAVTFQGCEDPPTVDFFFEVDVYTVTFTSTATNAHTYAWDFGDGNISAQTNPIHTYDMAGEYDVTLTVVGDDGSASVTKLVATATYDEMLTGGDSKTWVLKNTYTPAKDGAGPTDVDFTVTLPTIDNVLHAFGLGMEYDNEYTFHEDGKLTIDSKNDSVLAAMIWGVMTHGFENILPSADYGSLPLCRAPYAGTSNATWEIKTDDLTVECDTEDPTNPDVITPETLTFTDESYFVFTNGGFLGYQDFQAEVFIKELTPDAMHCAIFLTSNEASVPKPSIFIHLTFVPKPN